MLDGFKWHLLISSQSCRSKGMADFFFLGSPTPKIKALAFVAYLGALGKNPLSRSFRLLEETSFLLFVRLTHFPAATSQGWGRRRVLSASRDHWPSLVGGLPSQSQQWYIRSFISEPEKTSFMGSCDSARPVWVIPVF